ncbi:MAG: hypothetical protein KTR21_16905 [Rhodobacteraceae bacterium]|nr:hypothetical protein [Paracoccaceae bacterium]
MSEDKDGKPGAKGGRATIAGAGEEERKARLGAALRANLQRRKAQARGRADLEPGAQSETPPPTSQPDEE